MDKVDDIRAQACSLYPVLARLRDEELTSILEAAKVLHIPRGTLLFDEGKACNLFPLVLEGSIRVVKAGAQGRELPLYRVGEGETCIVTSSCLLGNAAYSVRGVAETDLKLVALSREGFMRLIDHSPFRDFVFGLFAERIAELMALVEEVAFHKLDQRLAALLLGKGRMVHATHQQLADELGSVREIVTRLLKGFAEQGFVALGREQLEILDAPGLRRIASRSG